MFTRFRSDIQCILDRDPAARTRWEVITCYPGLHAIWFHRVAHALWRRGFRWLGRWLSHWGRFLTGIEIHPGARIGDRVFIDHGMGVVIGETAEVGDGCTIYQGVTLGGTSLDKGAKRHPTLGRGVVVGASAKVLGGFTVGDGAKIGSAAVVTKPVPAGATAVGNPARVIVADALLAESPHAEPASGQPVPGGTQTLAPRGLHTASQDSPAPAHRDVSATPATMPGASAASVGSGLAGRPDAPAEALGAAAATADRGVSGAGSVSAGTSAGAGAAASPEHAPAQPGGFVAYGVTSGDDPLAQALRGLIAGTAEQDAQIALLWQAVEQLSQRLHTDGLPADVAHRPRFDAAQLNQIMGK